MTHIGQAVDGSSSDPAPPALIGFCPHCGTRLDVQAFVQEYWSGSARQFHVWCHSCGCVFDIAATERVLTHEPAH